VIAAFATLVAPFALASRMRLLDGWRDLAGPAVVFGLLTVAVLAANGALQGTGAQGWSQRAAAVFVPIGIVVLAMRTRRLANADAKTVSGPAASGTRPTAG
jgi:hypothetical protein